MSTTAPAANARLRPGASVEKLNQRSVGSLPGWFGLEVTAVEPGVVSAQLEIAPHMLAPNGFLHAATIIALADTLCGYASAVHLPDGAENFTTVELKSNFFGTQTQGTIRAVATAMHAGRTTQVWDAEVTGDGGKRLALFRCTQMVLWPKAAS
jgi:uncharacterized protein (TIGR00369 family)